MSTKKLEIPEWTGSALTLAAFLNYSLSVLKAFAKQGFNNLALSTIGPELQAEVNRLAEFINQPRAFDETPEITKADTKRDSLWKALWYAWHYVMQLDPTDPLYQAALQLRPTMTAYKGVYRHELTKETMELEGLHRDLSTEANAAALETLGLDSIAAGIFAANTIVANVTSEREQTRGQRIAQKGDDTTSALRKQIVVTLTDAIRQVNALDRIQSSAATTQAIQDVCGIIEHYKLVAAQPASKQGDGSTVATPVTPVNNVEGD